MGKIFAGLLFVFLHFRINGFDLLPDFVGYILIWLGMKSVQESESWQKNWSAIAACIVSGISLVQGAMGVTIVGALLGLAAMLLQLLALYDIVRGVLELEEYTGSDLRADELRKCCLFVAVCSVLSYVGTLVEPAAAVVPAVLAFMGIICYLVYYFKAWKAYEVWQEGQHTSI